MNATAHHNLADGAMFNGEVYCYKLDEKVKYTQGFVDNTCSKCNYLVGSAYGRGVSCMFVDGSGMEEVFHILPADSEKWAKYTAVRLGTKTREEVDNELKLTSELTTDEELGISKK